MPPARPAKIKSSRIQIEAKDGPSLDRIVLLLLNGVVVELKLFVALVVTVGGGAPALTARAPLPCKAHSAFPQMGFWP